MKIESPYLTHKDVSDSGKHSKSLQSQSLALDAGGAGTMKNTSKYLKLAKWNIIWACSQMLSERLYHSEAIWVSKQSVHSSLQNFYEFWLFSKPLRRGFYVPSSITSCLSSSSGCSPPASPQEVKVPGPRGPHWNSGPVWGVLAKPFLHQALPWTWYQQSNLRQIIVHLLLTY